MTNYTIDWGIMSTNSLDQNTKSSHGFIFKDDPVYLYRIIRNNGKNASNGSYKKFILVKAWSSKGNDVLHEGRRFFDFFYNGRYFRHQEVGLNEFLPFNDKLGFNIWSYERKDDYAIAKCKEWLESVNQKTKQKINAKARKLIFDREFCNTLSIEDNL